MFRRRRKANDFAEEIKAHLELEADALRHEGLSEEEARRKAHVEFGSVTAARERFYLRNRVEWFDNLARDLRFAIRQMFRNPGFAATSILVLALGIGASVAIFAFVDAALIKPLPYQQPDRIVAVFETVAGCPRCNVSYPNFRDWQKHDLPFSSVQAWGFSLYLLPVSTGAESVTGARVTDGFFRTLGVKPLLGRDFYSGEDAKGTQPTVLISYGTWMKRFGGRADVVGQTVKLTDNAYTIIGVLPRDFHFAPRNAEFWVTLNDSNGCEQRRSCHSLFALARLKDGVSVERAVSQMKAIAQQMAQQYPENHGFSADVVPLSEQIVGELRPVLLLLLSGSALLLLIACINVSSLLLVRSEARRREIAVRGALGASPVRLMRQFVTEGMVLAGSGCVLGLAAAGAAMRLLLMLIPSNMLTTMPYLQGMGFSLHVLVFAAAISILAILLFSIAPALRLARKDVQADLVEGGRSSAGTLWSRIGSKLVIFELAMAVVLLVGAGLLAKSLYRLFHVDMGMQTDHLATLVLSLPGPYGDTKSIDGMEREVLRAIESLPGVKSAGFTTSLPSQGWGMATDILVPGRPRSGVHNTVAERDVSPDYLKTLGAKLLRGRYFTSAEDSPDRPHVAVINRSLAQQYFPGQDPIGKHLLYEVSMQPTEIIGMVEDVKEGELDTVNRPALYDNFSSFWFRSFFVVVRTSQSEQTMLPEIANAVHRVDPGIATSYAMTMSDVINGSESAYMHRACAWLIGGFAVLALLLGVVGLYGVIAYSVSQRTREVGVRMALGAQRTEIYALVMRQAGWLTAIGLACGLVCAMGASLLIRSLLFGVKFWDVTILGSVVAALAAVSILASFLPARRAASVNPVVALRAE